MIQPLHLGTTARPRAQTTSLCLALASALSFYVLFIWRTGFETDGRTFFTLVDDAMISMRYARNLVEGYELSWNVGEPPVEGYSNLLWTMWMALLHLLPVPEEKLSLLVMVTGVPILLANVLTIRALTAMLTPAPGSQLAVELATWLTAFYFPLVFWTLRGMEVGVAALLVSGAILLALKLNEVQAPRFLFGLAALICLALLTRDDLLVPCAVVIGYVVLTARQEHRRSVLVTIVEVLVATLAAHLLLRLAYYGDFVPNTYHVKVGGVPWLDRLYRGTVALSYTSLTHLYAPITVVIVYFGFNRDELSARRGALLTVLLLTSMYSVYVGGDAFEATDFSNRFLAPVTPLLLALAGVAVSGILTSVPAMRRRCCWTIAAVIGAAAAASARDFLPVQLLGLDAEVHLLRFRHCTRPCLTVHAAALCAQRRPRRFRGPSEAAAPLGGCHHRRRRDPARRHQRGTDEQVGQRERGRARARQGVGSLGPRAAATHHIRSAGRRGRGRGNAVLLAPAFGRPARKDGPCSRQSQPRPRDGQARTHEVGLHVQHRVAQARRGRAALAAKRS